MRIDLLGISLVGPFETFAECAVSIDDVDGLPRLAFLWCRSESAIEFLKRFKERNLLSQASFL